MRANSDKERLTMDEGKKRILIADDEQEFLKTLKMILETHDYEVITAFDGQEALEKVRQHKPDAIVLDISMPKLDGHEVRNRLQSEQTYRHIPVVMLTAHGQYEDIKAGIDGGAVSYITKPFKVEVLLGIIKGLM